MTCEEGHDEPSTPLVISTQSHAERHPVLPTPDEQRAAAEADPRVQEMRAGLPYRPPDGAQREDAAYNHPAHYGGAENPHEAIKCIHAHGLDFDLGNAVKYIFRAGKKDATKVVEDLRKAIWYIESEIALVQEQS